MELGEEAIPDTEPGEYVPEHSPEVLLKKIEYLEEELVRKEQAIESLKKENLILFRTALKNSESKVDSLKAEEDSE